MTELLDPVTPGSFLKKSFSSLWEYLSIVLPRKLACPRNASGRLCSEGVP